MENGTEIAKNIGIIASLVGFVGTAVKVGQWKGEHGKKLEMLETLLEKTVDKMSRMDDRIDGIERELLRNITAIQKDIEYIKMSVAGKGMG